MSSAIVFSARRWLPQEEEQEGELLARMKCEGWTPALMDEYLEFWIGFVVEPVDLEEARAALHGMSGTEFSRAVTDLIARRDAQGAHHATGN